MKKEQLNTTYEGKTGMKHNSYILGQNNNVKKWVPFAEKDENGGKEGLGEKVNNFIKFERLI